MHAEKGSLEFDKEGNIRRFSTVRDRVTVTDLNGNTRKFVPRIEEDPYTGFPVWVPVKVEFTDDAIKVSAGKNSEEVFDRNRHRISVNGDGSL